MCVCECDWCMCVCEGVRVSECEIVLETGEGEERSSHSSLI